MEIKIVYNSINTNDDTKYQISLLIKEFCSRLDFSTDYIEKIVFSDENNYINEIKQINPLEEYTNTSTYKGMGKTLYIPERNTNIIVYRSIVFFNLVFIINQTMESEDCKQITLFLLLHEIGHCITNIKEKSIIESGGNKLFNISEIPLYYFNIIIDEFSANRNIIIFIRKEWVFYELENIYLNDLFTLSKTLISYREIETVQNIWFFIKRFMDIGAFLIDYDHSDFMEILDKLELPFDITKIIIAFQKLYHNIISKNKLFCILTNIVKELMYEYNRELIESKYFKELLPPNEADQVIVIH